jgi:hypothetical protein
MRGFRVEIQPEDAGNLVLQYYSGFSDRQPGSVFAICPNCTNQMFPAINIDCHDLDVAVLDGWRQRYLNVLFCPFCDFYMKPYWIRFDRGLVADIRGGAASPGNILQNIETPYGIREIRLCELASEDSSNNNNALDMLRERKTPPGVYHQLGGLPIRGESLGILCPYCGEMMPFAGILDYDDLNVPLYEDGHRPVALIIGDFDSINFYICTKCSSLGFLWVQ